MIYHIAEEDEWLACANKPEYLPKTYEKDGFIHCSDGHQIERVANLLFKGKKDLILLKIDPSRLSSQIIYESPQGTIEKFPHIYRTIDKQAIVRVSQLTCNENGEFEIAAQEL
jgi:uncharacterized protein (DUF952 family)